MASCFGLVWNRTTTVRIDCETRMSHPVESFNAIRLTVCQVDKAHLPAWLSDIPESRNNNTIVAVTWLPPEVVSQTGLPKDSICGFLTEPMETVAPEQFAEYRIFVGVIHGICRDHVDPQLVGIARRTNAENIALIDQRSPDVDAEIPTEDIIGSYQIKHRSVCNFSPNPNFRLVTARGCFQLTPWLRKCLWSLVLPAK